MRRHAVIFLLCALSLVANASAAEVQLRIDATHTFPGIPVSFVLRITNSSRSIVDVPETAILVAHSEQGETFTVFCAGSVLMELSPKTSLQPKESVVYEIATDGTLLKPSWFLDGRLYRPGTYRLEAYVPSKVADQIVRFEELPTDAWRSNSVTLTVDEPHGADAEVWGLMQEFGKGSWHPMKALTHEGEALAKRIVTQYPASAYAGWFASWGLGTSIDERAERLRDWLTHHDAKDTITERRKLLLSIWDSILADKYSITEPEKSQRYSLQARSTLRAIVSESTNAAIRSQASERLRELTENTP